MNVYFVQFPVSKTFQYTYIIFMYEKAINSSFHAFTPNVYDLCLN